MAIPILPIVSFLSNNWKIILTAAIAAFILKLAYDFGYNKSTVYHQKEISLLEQREADRIKELNKNLLFQISLNSSLVKEKEKFEKAIKEKDRKHKLELEKLKNEQENIDWLHTPIPPSIIEFLQDSGSKN